MKALHLPSSRPAYRTGRLTGKIKQKALMSLIMIILSKGISAQQKQIQYLSGTDSKHTVQWDFFCTCWAKQR